MKQTIKQIVNELWKDHFVKLEITNKIASDPMVRFNIINQKQLDVEIFDYDRIIGYIELERLQEKYQIISDFCTNHHPGFESAIGLGIQVKEKYKKRNIGHGLLSLGIGIAQIDFEHQQMPSFNVIAKGISDCQEFYKKFGFEIDDESKHASYKNPDSVPEL
ncbi:hypothetical protein J4456_02505 [Candidatus Pacearchaeota archaeon]|nr:hypothetical protein [Candidatus Pacearchaeota archaeon]